MIPPANWVPMHWPCGLLEIQRREKLNTLTREAKDTLHTWQDPALLTLLQGTPINCLIVPWASGLPQEALHQQNLRPLVKACQEGGIEVVGLVEEAADKVAAAVAAKEVGLSALAMEQFPDAGIPLDVIPWAERN